jgi:hypothetical protein
MLGEVGRAVTRTDRRREDQGPSAQKTALTCCLRGTPRVIVEAASDRGPRQRNVRRCSSLKARPEPLARLERSRHEDPRLVDEIRSTRSSSDLMSTDKKEEG